jgi:hypothetical protein
MLTNKIPTQEIIFHQLSERDTNGRVFKWNGQIYRGITTEKTAFYLDLFAQGIIPELIAKKLLIDTKITDLQLDNYGLVLQHRLIPFVSYPREWCDLMLKDAALLHLDLCWEIAHHDLITKDAYPLNIIFDGVEPFFVDLCSIESGKNMPSLWTEYDEFCRLFIHPLHLMSHNHERIARWLLHDLEDGVLCSEMQALIGKPSKANKRLSASLIELLRSSALAARLHLPPRLLSIIKQIRTQDKKALLNSSKTKTQTERVAFFAQIREEVVSIKLPPLKTPSLSYGDTKEQFVKQMLDDLQPNSVLDIDSSHSQGFYSLLAAKYTQQVVSFHTSNSTARQLYSKAKANCLSILPLLIDFNSPNCGLSNEWYTPIQERLKCDLVLAIDLVERLVFKQGLNFERIAARLAAFAQRWLLVEFVLHENISNTRFTWYQIDYFIQVLRKHFSQIKILSSTLGSQLLLCEKL